MDDCCPICQETFCDPKGLPCFHTFCRECLQMYIDRFPKDITCFNCPMCRQTIYPFDRQIPKSEWAKSFPTNTYIRQSQTELHQCSTHFNEILNINCKTCKMLICLQCCLSTHEKCEKILRKISAENIKKTLLLRQDNLKEKLKPLEGRLHKLQENRKTTENQINQISKELLDFVQEKEKYWLQEVDTYNPQEKKNDLIEIVEKLNENIDELDSFISEKETASGPQSFRTFNYHPKHVLIKKMTELHEPIDIIGYQVNPNFLKIKDEILKIQMVEQLTSTPQKS